MGANFTTFKGWFNDVANSRLVARFGSSTDSIRLTATGVTVPGTMTVTGASTLTGGVAAAAGVTSSSASAGIGYATGAGGTVTQATSRTTGVTLSKTCGQITTDTSSLAAGAEAEFTVTNTTVAATDVVVVTITPGGPGTPHA